MAKVYLAVVSYNHYSALSRCIRSLSNLNHRHLYVHVWDNSEESKRYQYTGVESLRNSFLETHRSGDLEWTACPSNILWTPALNKMVKHALANEFDYIMTLNHDVQLPPNCVTDLVKAFDELPEHAGAIGPCGHGMGGQQGWTVPRSDRRERVNFLIGAATMYKREVFEKIGLFDEKMALSADDFDFAIRMKEAGYSLWVDEQDEPIQHVGHITAGSSNWGDPAKASWDAFNAKYDGYYADETEARLGLWNGPYSSLYPFGTGIDREEKIRRRIIR